jgi:hypothetical protein
MSELTVLDAVELMPVIELTPGTFSTHERSSPSGSGLDLPEEWNRYWLDSLADSGVVGLNPIRLWSWLVPTRQLTDAVVLNRILTVLVREWGGPDVFSDPDMKPVLNGGLALRNNDDLLVAPTCCSDLGNLSDWKQALEYRQSSWKMLWIGHPWLSVRFDGKRLVLSDLHESDSPVARWTISHEDLGRAVAEAEAELEVFAQRLEVTVAAFNTKEDAVRASRRLAGLEAE